MQPRSQVGKAKGCNDGNQASCHTNHLLPGALYCRDADVTDEKEYREKIHRERTAARLHTSNEL